MRMLFWIILIAAFLIVGGFIIINSSGYNLSENEGRSAFIKDYSAWLGNLFKNVRGITSYTTSLDWLPPHK